MRELRCSPSQRIHREYPIFVGTGILKDQLPVLLKSHAPDKCIIITDTNVGKRYGDFVSQIAQTVCPTESIAMPAGELNKTPAMYLEICDKVISKGITKKSMILLLGGGVPGNLGGFVASTLMRGIRFAHIPTTIIAQADSTTGGKQGVDTKHGKNMLGLFNDPEFIIADTEFLKDLPAREIRCGLAECIKHALCQDEEFVSYLLQHLNPEAKYS